MRTIICLTLLALVLANASDLRKKSTRGISTVTIFNDNWYDDANKFTVVNKVKLSLADNNFHYDETKDNDDAAGHAITSDYKDQMLEGKNAYVGILVTWDGAITPSANHTKCFACFSVGKKGKVKKGKEGIGACYSSD